MILINPKKEILVPVGLQFGVKGYFRVQCIRPDGRVRQDTGWFPNLLLTSGRNEMGKQDFLTSCQVGTDNTAPNAAQTALLGFHQGSTTITTSTSGGESVTPPYYGWARQTYRFPVGVGPSNLSEVGVGWGTSGSTLLTRALILDPDLGTPTTVSPLADELLDVTYELRYYSPSGDTSGPTVTLDGVNYDTVTRASNAGSAQWYNIIGSEVSILTPSVADYTAYDGALGAETSEPSGTNTNMVLGSISASAYSNNSYERDINAICGSTGWNLGSGIRSIRIRTAGGAYQTSFTSNPGGNTIPKTSSYTMNMQWTISWAERP